MLSKMCFEIVCLIHMYKKDLALNNQQWLICHKTKPSQTKPNQTKSLVDSGNNQGGACCATIIIVRN